MSRGLTALRFKMVHIANMESIAEKALRETRNVVDVSLLKHLPAENVRVAAFNDQKLRPNTLPVRMLFGQLKDGVQKGYETWILLHKAHTEDRSPEQRFNIFDRHGRLQGGITAEEAVRRTEPVNAFRCLQLRGVIETVQLRAVVKYYFIFKKVEPPLPWPIDARFTSALVAACKVASDFPARVKHKNDMIRDSGAYEAYQRRESVFSQQAADCWTPVNGPKAGTASAFTKADSVQQRSMTPQRSDALPSSSSPEGSSGLFVSENPRPSSSQRDPILKTLLTAPTGPSTQRLATVKSTMTSEPHTVPRAISAPRSSSSQGFGFTFPIPQDTQVADANAAAQTPRPAPAEGNIKAPLVSESSATFCVITTLTSWQEGKSPNPQSSVLFVSEFRKTLNAIDAYNEKMEANKAKKTELQANIAALEMELLKLGDEDRQLMAEHKEIKVTKKRLRDSLSSDQRELLELGAEVERRKSKRVKTAGADGDGGDEDSE